MTSSNGDSVLILVARLRERYTGLRAWSDARANKTRARLAEFTNTLVDVGNDLTRSAEDGARATEHLRSFDEVAGRSRTELERISRVADEVPPKTSEGARAMDRSRQAAAEAEAKVDRAMDLLHQAGAGSARLAAHLERHRRHAVLAGTIGMAVKAGATAFAFEAGPKMVEKGLEKFAGIQLPHKTDDVAEKILETWHDREKRAAAASDIGHLARRIRAGFR